MLDGLKFMNSVQKMYKYLWFAIVLILLDGWCNIAHILDWHVEHMIKPKKDFCFVCGITFKQPPTTKCIKKSQYPQTVHVCDL